MVCRDRTRVVCIYMCSSQARVRLPLSDVLGPYFVLRRTGRVGSGGRASGHARCADPFLCTWSTWSAVCNLLLPYAGVKTPQVKRIVCPRGRDPYVSCGSSWRRVTYPPVYP
eukprot:6594958-Prymnesium_polylepis.1